MGQNEAITKASEHDTGRYYKLVQETENSVLFIAYDRRADFWEYINLSRYVDAAKIYHDGCWMIDGEELPYKEL